MPSLERHAQRGPRLAGPSVPKFSPTFCAKLGRHVPPLVAAIEDEVGIQSVDHSVQGADVRGVGHEISLEMVVQVFECGDLIHDDTAIKQGSLWIAGT